MINSIQNLVINDVFLIEDSSPLIALAGVKQLNLLPRLYSRVIAPSAVIDEILAGGENASGLNFLDHASWLEQMRGRQGGIPFTLPPPKTGPGVKGYLGPVVVFMGICINTDQTLRRATNVFGVKFRGKKMDPGRKIWKGIKKLSICGIFH